MITIEVVTPKSAPVRKIPDLTPAMETVDFLVRLFPTYNNCPKISEGLRKGFFSQQPKENQ